MKYSELIRKLKANGCYEVSHGARHDKWYCPKTNRHFTVPRHTGKEVPKGTEKSIFEDAGL